MVKKLILKDSAHVSPGIRCPSRGQQTYTKKLITEGSCADLLLFFSSGEGPETYAKGTCHQSLVRNLSWAADPARDLDIISLFLGSSVFILTDGWI